MKKFSKLGRLAPPPCMAGQNHCTPPCMVAGLKCHVAPGWAGPADVDPATDHGGLQPRRASWRGAPAPYLVGRTVISSHLSPSLTPSVSLSLPLSHPSSALLRCPSASSFTSIAPPRRPSPLRIPRVVVLHGCFSGHPSFG